MMETDTPESPSPSPVYTGGGAYVAGNVDTRGGDFIGRDQVILTEERAYDVRGLPDPYPGLLAYTYAGRAGFAGREATVQVALEHMTDPAGRHSLTFITGVSGCGKSSFAQAGLLPALEAYYAARHKQARLVVFRPSTSPLAFLGDALAQLGLPEPATAALAQVDLARLLIENTPAAQVNLLLIDQFEELFSQSPPEQSRALFGLLAGLPPFEQGRTHVLATLRSDYLEELFNHPDLWQVAVHRGVELRAMTAEELQAAILGPLEARAQDDERYRRARFESGLLAQLAHDASADPAYLPLLQVSLGELWAGGSLKLERYRGLAQAIEQRAEKVYASRDFDQPSPAQPRPPAEQAELLAILVDLVNISLDEDARRDVRRQRPKEVLEKVSPLRRGLIEDLLAARLLSTGVEKTPEGQVETIDIIHETVLQKWERLRREIHEQRELLRRRARFEQELSAWLSHERSEEYLLSGAHLKEARLLGKNNDLVLQGVDAQEFVRCSDRSWRSQQKAPLRLRLFYLIIAGGALGFMLGFGITYFSQIASPGLFLVILLIELIPGLIGSALYTLGILLPVMGAAEALRRWPVLSGGLAGAVGFSAMLVASGILGSVAGFIDWMKLLAEGVLWGAVAGAGILWALSSSRPAWLTWGATGLASGLALALGELFGHAFQRGNLGGEMGIWQVYLAGAIVPLAILLAIRLGRSQGAYRDLLQA